MGAGSSAFAAIRADKQTSMSAMKSPQSHRRNLHVSFTTSDLDKHKTGNVYTPLPTKSSLKSGRNGTENIPISGAKVNYGNGRTSYNHSNGIKDVTDCLPNGVQPYRPTHLPPSYNISNNNHLSEPGGFKSTQNGQVFSDPRASISNLSRTSSSSRYSRARSISPRRLERVIAQGSISRSEMEHIKSSIRSARSASASRKPSLSAPTDSSRMTSFVVGKPAMFSPGAFGDRGIFKAISAVNENLYICGVMALSEEKIKAIKINCVINATLEWPPYKIPGLETIRVQVDDVPSSNLAPYFDKVADKMNEVISGGGRVLVHCMAGISRSSTLCIAYLMKHRGASLQQAYSLMKTKRPLIRPNDGFWRQLVQYEKELQRRKTASRNLAQPYGKYRTTLF